MILEQRLEAQLAALDRLELDVFLVPPEDQEIADLRKGVVAKVLVAAWSNRLSNAGKEGLAASCSRIIRGQIDTESDGAKLARGCEACWDATEGGQPLSWELFMLIPGIPWLDIVREVLGQQLI